MEGGELKGFLLVYVDDLIVVGDGGTIEVITKMLQAEWETSPPEEVNTRDKVKFLGMELKKGPWGEFTASQEDYIKDKEGIEEKKGVKAPMGKDLCPSPEEPTPDLVTQAQKLVGELMWLSTRTRPDIAFATSRCAQEILSHPTWVVEQATQVWRYLKNTPNEGLKFTKEKGEGWDGGPRALEVFTDSSFAANPETQASHESVMVTWNGALMFWKSGKQAFPALSTAESELLEAIEGLQTGDAVDCLINEHEELYKKTLFVDNLAATGFFADGNANWRTRHLRLRAQHVRWRITNLDWRVRHLPGAVMIADLGTKALTIQRTKELKELMMMLLQEEKEKEDGPGATSLKDEKKDEEEEKNKEDGPEATRSKEGKEEERGKERAIVQLADGRTLQLAVLMAILAKAKAQGERDDGPLQFFMIMYTLLVIFVTLILRRLWAWLITPAIPGGDQAGGPQTPVPCPQVPSPPRFYSSDSSSQGSSLTVDNQGREVNRHSARSKGKTKGQGKGKGKSSTPSSPAPEDHAYGPAPPMTREQQIQWANTNREWLMRWASSLTVEERQQAGLTDLQEPLITSSSSAPSEVTLTGIQEEPEQEVPAEREVPPIEPTEEETLHHPTERDYRDIQADEAWEPTDSAGSDRPSMAKAFPRPFQAAGDPAGNEGQDLHGLGVYITKYGQKYHVFMDCQTLTSSVLRASPPCHQCGVAVDMNRIRRGQPIWCRGWGEIYHRGDNQLPGCASIQDRKYSICVLCPQAMRDRGLGL